MLVAAPPPACTVLRFGTICGLSGRMRFDLLVSEMAKKCARGDESTYSRLMPGGRFFTSPTQRAHRSYPPGVIQCDGAAGVQRGR